MSAPALFQRRTDELTDVGRRLALGLFLIYLFLIFSRITDFVLGRLHLPGFFFLMAIPAALMCGAWSKITWSGPLRYLTAFTLWLVAAVPFSVWRGGSFQQVRAVMMVMAMFIPILGLPAGYRDLRKMFLVVATAVGLFSMVSVIGGQFLAGRIAASGTFGNTNDLAQIILMGLPFLVFLIYDFRNNKVVAVAGVLGLLPMVVALMKTGSRSMVLAVGVMFTLTFLKASLTAKLRLLILAGVVLAAGIVLIPRTLLLRFSTFFSPGETANLTEGDYNTQASALASTNERRQLLKDSLKYTIQHPIFGVGPGMFLVARGQDYEKQNITGAWRVSHNAYTQVSSECGIPALIFFLMALGSGFVALHRAARYHQGLNHPVSADIRRAAYTLQMALVSYVIFAFFLSIPYQAQMVVLLAMSMSLERVSAIERGRLLAASVGAAPAAPGPPQQYARRVLPG